MAGDACITTSPLVKVKLKLRITVLAELAAGLILIVPQKERKDSIIS